MEVRLLCRLNVLAIFILLGGLRSLDGVLVRMGGTTIFLAPSFLLNTREPNRPSEEKFRPQGLPAFREK